MLLSINCSFSFSTLRFLLLILVVGNSLIVVLIGSLFSIFGTHHQQCIASCTGRTIISFVPVSVSVSIVVAAAISTVVVVAGSGGRIRGEIGGVRRRRSIN